MNSALDPAILGAGQVAKIINGQIKDQLITTRIGTKVVPTTGANWREGNVQGAKFYDPSRGQGAQVFSDDSASIILASCGKKYRVFPTESGPAEVEDITDDNIQKEDVHLVWLSQAENHLIAGDGTSSTFLYDGITSSFSTGFVGTGDRENSSVPQGIRAPVYAHGRLWVVVDARRILASDSLHGENLTNSDDLLKFTEQTYWATGQYFVPPSAMGNIMAAEILPQRDTRTGQGEIMFHCVNGGIFSINGNIYPRTSWSDTPMVNHFLLDTAAAGPYALDLQEGDQIFRSRSGIQTLRSARAESRLVGRPLKPISEEVSKWLDADHVPYLRFSSLVNWAEKERLLCTVAPRIQGAHRYHKGLVSLNWDPMDSTQQPASWEGLWTFPKDYRYITSLTRGMFFDSERVFGFHFDGERNSLVEYDNSLKHDILEDGTEKPIQMVIETREVTNTNNPFNKFSVASGTLFLRHVDRNTAWTVYARNDGDSRWTKWRDGSISNDQCIDPCSLAAQQERNVEFELGKLPESLLPGRRWQFRIEIEGYAAVEGLTIRTAKVSDDNAFVAERLNITDKDRKVDCSNDYSYSE